MRDVDLQTALGTAGFLLSLAILLGIVLTYRRQSHSGFSWEMVVAPSRLSTPLSSR